MSQNALDPVDDMLAALRAAAEPTRLRILALCAEGELSVSDLVHILDQSQPRVSRHLKLLTEAGLIDRFREGTFAFFRLSDRGGVAPLARSLLTHLPDDSGILTQDRVRLAEIKQDRATQAAIYFSRNAAEWDEIGRLHIADKEVEKALIRMLPAGRIGDLIDVGTGTGRILSLMAHRADRAVGIDYSREMLAVARSNLDEAGLGRVQVRLGNINTPPVPDGSFDVAVMHQVLHYLQGPHAALARLSRILRPGGHLVIADFEQHDVEALREDHAHLWLGFPTALVNEWLDREGFEVLEVEHLRGDPLTVTVWCARKRDSSD